MKNPALLNVSYRWGENDTETAIQAAAQVGNFAIAELLLEKGAPLEICTAAMLGRDSDVRQRLDENPGMRKLMELMGYLCFLIQSGAATLILLS